MSNKIGFIVPDNEYMSIVNSVLFSEIQVGDLIAEVVSPGRIAEQAIEMIEKGVEALIARGGTYFDLSESITAVPVINISMSEGDIISALTKAEKEYERIFLILSSSIPFDIEEYRDLFDAEIIYYRFSNMHDLNKYIESIECSEKTVVIGSVLAASYARKQMIAGISIYNKEQTVLQTYERAKDILKQLQEEKQKNDMLQTLLYNIEDGVVVLDEAHKVSHFNRRSEQILARAAVNVIGKDVNEILPEFTSALAKYLRNKNEADGILKTNQTNLSYTISSINQSQRYGKEQVLITLKDITQLQELEKNLRIKLRKKGLTARYTFDDILTKDENMKTAIERARRCAVLDNTVLIYGESGTGKEMFAQSIHNYSRRKSFPFVAVNCAALTESLLESELFGYDAGAFTGARKEGKAGLFELAHGGTIFLDEINSMSTNTQAKILRVVEEREVMRVGSDHVIPLDVRIITASNDDLLNLVREGKFRQDLFFRLNVLELKIPPLKKRPKDIVFLFKYFISEMTGKSVHDIKIEKDFLKKLQTNKWWGNVRELRNVSYKYAVYEGDNSNGDIIFDYGNELEKTDFIGDDMRIDMKELNHTVENLVIESLLNKGVTKTETAKLLGISRTALFKKLEKNKSQNY